MQKRRSQSPSGLVCACCQNTIDRPIVSAFRAARSKDTAGFEVDVITGWLDYKLLCSHCSQPICVSCATEHHERVGRSGFERMYYLGGVMAHVAKFYPLKWTAGPYRHSERIFFLEKPWYLLCDNCSDLIGVKPDFSKFVRMAEETYTRTGRTEELAQLYEALGLADKAGEVRKQARQLTVKEVSVDLNQLVERLQNAGLAVPYKCRNCGAAITVNRESSVEGLKFCSYCGTAVDIDSLMAVLKGVLG